MEMEGEGTMAATTRVWKARAREIVLNVFIGCDN